MHWKHVEELFEVMSSKNDSHAVVGKSGKKVTIYDLARHTGFSPGTVSRVLNNKDKVKPETREKILQAAQELNLKPQVSARSRQIAIISEPTYTDRIEGYAATLTAHLAFACSRKNMGVVLPSDPFEQLSGKFLDGIIVVTSNEDLLRLVAEMEDRIPVIYMDHFYGMEDRYRVCSDHYRSGYLAAEYFLQSGKKKPGFFGGEGQAFGERLRGFKDALQEAKHTLNDKFYVQAAPGTHQSVITRLIRAGVDSVFVPGASFQAMESLHLLTYIMGLKVPDDVSIIGGENEGISAIQCPPLTTVEEPLKDMAEVAVDMLDKCTSGQQIENKSVILPVRLIERNSVS